MTLAKAFAEMEGDWEGTAAFVDPAGRKLSLKRLTVACRIDGAVMSIVNTFVDEAGTATVARVRGAFDAAGRLHIESERTKGVAWESDGNVLAVWSAKADPALRYWELATIHGGTYRTRTWHHLNRGRLEGVTVFEERKIAPAPARS